MLRWIGRQGERVVVGIGLEPKNVEWLMDGKSVIVSGNAMGVPYDICIHYGATTDAMIAVMKAAVLELLSIREEMPK